jgi:hypothetical protein
MKDVPENELFSAYLDGELTAEEQAEVEKLLATSPAARQLLDELRALSSSLQALPTYQIGEDISQQVLRLAAQGKLDQHIAAEGPKEAGEQPEGPVWRAMVRRLTRPRNWVWAGIAVAVALLLMVMQSDWLSEPVGREIAMETEMEDASRAASQPAATMEAGEAADAEMVPEYPPEAELAPREMKRGRTDLVAGKPGPRDAMFAPAPAASAPATPPALRAASEPTIAEPTEARVPVEGARAGYGGMGVGRGVAKESSEIEVEVPASGRPSKDQPEFAMKKGEAVTEVMGPQSSTGTKADQPPPDGQPPEPALVVSCWGTPAALQELAFERLLEEQGIQRVDAAGPEAGGTRFQARAPQRGQIGSDTAQAGPSGLRQAVDVEATRDQLRGLMLTVQRQPGQLSFAYAVPGNEGLALNGRRLRAVDRARGGPAVQAADELAAGAAQPKPGRMEVDKLLGLLERAATDDQMRRKAGIGVLAEEQRPFADSAFQMQTAPGDVASSAELYQQTLPSKSGPPGAFGAAGVRTARPSTARESGLAGQSAAPPEMPAPLEVAAPMEPAPEVPPVEMGIAAQPSQADEEERVAKESPKGPGARPSRPRPVRDESEKRFAKAKMGKQPGSPVPAEQPDRYARTYRVRFEFHAVEGPGGVAASIAQEAAAARMAEETPTMLDAAAEPPAAAAPAVQEQP